MGLGMVHHESYQHGSILASYQAEQLSYVSSPKTFEDYMFWRLYDPSWGYYQRDRLGKDFFTAPMKSKMLAYALWKKLQPDLRAGDEINWMEIGPGRLELSTEMLHLIDKNHVKIKSIILVERSERLREWQADYIKSNWCESWASKVKIIDRVSETYKHTVCIGHEVLDAFPVSRVCYQGGSWYEVSVGAENDQLVLMPGVKVERPSSPWVDSDYEDGSMYEVCHSVRPWLESLLSYLPSSKIMWIDYGDDAYHIYHPSRLTGTLRSYYEGKMVEWNHPNADMTTDVNWSDIGQIMKPFVKDLSFSRQSELMALALPDMVEDGLEIDSCHRYFFDPSQMDRRIFVMSAGIK